MALGTADLHGSVLTENPEFDALSLSSPETRLQLSRDVDARRWVASRVDLVSARASAPLDPIPMVPVVRIIRLGKDSEDRSNRY